MSSRAVPVERKFPEGPAVRGFLHQAETAGGDALVLTHGAGSNCEAPLLVGLAEQFAAAGVTVLRCDLPYRQRRPKGSPFPSGAAEDREGLRRAVAVAREFAAGRIYMGGQSYGGRQATILASEAPGLIAALLLISYPLHPPGKPGRPAVPSRSCATWRLAPHRDPRASWSRSDGRLDRRIRALRR